MKRRALRGDLEKKRVDAPSISRYLSTHFHPVAEIDVFAERFPYFNGASVTSCGNITPFDKENWFHSPYFAAIAAFLIHSPHSSYSILQFRI